MAAVKCVPVSQLGVEDERGPEIDLSRRIIFRTPERVEASQLRPSPRGLQAPWVWLLPT